MIGVYLVFASLIFPALAVVKLQRNKMIIGISVSIVSYFLGLICSYLFDWPAGPSIVIALAFTCLAINLRCGFYFDSTSGVQKRLD